MPGYQIERVRFDKWLPLAEGFAAVPDPPPQGRGASADVVLRLRAALHLTDDGFRKFNEHYVEKLVELGHL